ncbi:MAG: aminopeptidase N [Gammaproteobacteria bacterium]|nr:aminopeptidase N [Gammaproteobacteria bacterium]
MIEATPKTIYLKDYQPPLYQIASIDLKFDLYDDKTLVHSTLVCQLNKAHPAYQEKNPRTLILNGEKLVLHAIQLDGRTLSSSEYQVDSKSLTLFNVPEHFRLEIKTEIYPDKNTELAGLFRSKTLFCTQCESEGFRRMTYYLDRPDVMSKFTTTISADKYQYPVLLSNGNCVARGNADNGRHWVKWEDPFLKPCYLFALVSGDLVSIEDYFVTKTGRLVTLKIFVERENLDKCPYAMEALKKSMRWDEDTYGREYDLDIYMIVAVNDFNMGAMENKGLNVFNSKYILARPETATDSDYQNIDAVVGHEYFHNWSGNRVTCRDWFQLSLKEGLTVFREHHFSKDISKSPISLIENVRILRSHQFAEDSGPMAHSVRPEAYMEINNFYTMTVYEKGAEVIRMLKTLLGWETFRSAMDLYFERHDGQAVTTDDFVAAMEAASKQDLSQFKLWYQQAGTPEVTVQERYEEKTKTYYLTLKQFCPPTPEQPTKQPMVIPVAVGLLDKVGNNLLSQSEILILKEKEQTFSFPNIQYQPILSVLREFSAPVKVHRDVTDEQLAFLLAHDSDDFSKWDASQKLTERLIWKLIRDYQAKRILEVPRLWLEAYRAIMIDNALNPALKSEILTLPVMSYLLELGESTDIDAIAAVRLFLRKSLAENLKDAFLSLYKTHSSAERYVYSPVAVAARKLKNVCLSYLLLAGDSRGLDCCMQQWKSANNMTDALGVLNALSNSQGLESQTVLDEFYDKWKHDPLVLDKWFRVQACAELPNTVEVVKSLMQHPAFEITNPNKVYSLIGAFSANLVCFHDKSGSGYTFLADVVLELDKLNPQVASRMVRAFTSWKRFDSGRQEKMKAQLERIKSQKNLSGDIFEIVSKCLV